MKKHRKLAVCAVCAAAGVLIAWGVSAFFPRTWLHALHAKLEGWEHDLHGQHRK